MAEVLKRYEDQQSTQYSRSLNKLVRLISFEDMDVLNRSYGPKYYTTTKMGLPLVISTYSYTYLQCVTKDKMDVLAAIAQEEETGEIVGHMTNGIYGYPDSPNVLNASGEITVGKRGLGISTPLNLAFMDVLQRISDQGKIIKWWKSNDNLKTLKAYRKQYKNSSDPDEQKLLQLLEIEQQRWQSVYGASGTLGIEQYNELEGVRVFTPRTILSPKIDEIDTILFAPMMKEENGRRLCEINILKEEPVLEPKEHARIRENELRLIISPAIKTRVF